jgi:hypothetical protein
MILTFEQAETVLKNLMYDYLSDLNDNVGDGNGNIDWGMGEIGFKNKTQLVEDLLLYTKNK